ncbi:MAG: hypothetical protein IKN70_13085 [Fibrobacter sp.]|nr:hypothetical protein [Fibrobacter sp.]
MENKKPFMAAASLALFLALVVLSSCGDDITEVKEYYVVGIETLDAKQKMPTCDKNATGNLLYVTDSSAVFYCNGKKWVNMKSHDGKDGTNGQDGIDGENGAKGDRGDDGVSCSAQSVSNKAKTRKGIEFRCGETVVDTLWGAIDDDLGCSANIIMDADSTQYGVEVQCDGNAIDTLWGFVRLGSAEKSEGKEESSSESGKE